MSSNLPGYVLRPPDVSLAPPSRTRTQSLPFHSVGWENFERLVLRIVQLESDVLDCHLYGTPGQNQEGIDLYAEIRGTARKTVCYQCKRVRTFTSSKIEKAVTTFLNGKFPEKSDTFVLCTSADLSDTNLQDVIASQRDRLARQEIEFVLWDGSESGQLVQRLKNNPELVDDFFGRQWVKEFNGQNAADSLQERLDGVDYSLLRRRLFTLYTTIFLQHDPGIRRSSRSPYLTRYVPVDILDEQNEAAIDRTDSSHREEADAPLAPEDLSRVDNRASGKEGTPAPDRPSLRRPVWDWLENQSRCLIVGDPGLGKSALLRVLALTLLDPEAETEHGELNRRSDQLPVWIPFARLCNFLRKDNSLSVEGYFEDWLHQLSHSDLLPLFLRGLRSKQVLLLLDGLDESGSDRIGREAFIRILTFLEAHNAEVVCTSRPSGFFRLGFRSDWAIAKLAPLSDAQILSIASIWLNLFQAERSSDYGRRRASDFLSAVNSSSHTKDLCRVPLLCLAFVELFVYSHRLPEDKRSAYQKIVELLLLEHPESRSDVVLAEDSEVSLGAGARDLEEILIRIARRTMDGVSRLSISLRQCESICQEYLENEVDGLGLNATEARKRSGPIISHLVEVNGVLSRLSELELGFIHLSIQEYLCAKSITRMETVDQLDWVKSKGLKPKWRDCVACWFGIHASTGSRQIIVEAVSHLKERYAEGEWWRTQSLDLLCELACSVVGFPVGLGKEILEEANDAIFRTPFARHRQSLAKYFGIGSQSGPLAKACHETVMRLVPTMGEYRRASLLRALSNWEKAEDLRETLLLGLLDESRACRDAAISTLTVLFNSDERTQDAVYRMSLQDPRPFVRQSALTCLSSIGSTEQIESAIVSNEKTSHPGLIVSLSNIKIGRDTHTDTDLDKLLNVFVGDSFGFEDKDSLIRAFVDGWPTSEMLHRKFVEQISNSRGLMDLTVPLNYLVSARPGDDQTAKLLASLFDEYEMHLVSMDTSLSDAILSGFSGHHLLMPSIERALKSHKQQYEAIHWRPDTIACYQMLGSNAAAEELMLAYDSSSIRETDRYWIAKGLLGSLRSAQVDEYLTKQSRSAPDLAAPLSQWIEQFIPETRPRQEWLLAMARSSSNRILPDVLLRLLREFPDAATKEVVESKLDEGQMWYYHTTSIEESFAVAYPDDERSTTIIDKAFAEVDGPELTHIASGATGQSNLRKRILRHAVAAPIDARKSLLRTLNDRGVPTELAKAMRSTVWAESDSAARALSVSIVSQSVIGNGDAESEVSEKLCSELVSLGHALRERRRAAMVGLLSLGKTDLVAETLATEAGSSFSHQFVEGFGEDPVCLSAVIRNWDELKPKLITHGFEAELPYGSIFESGYEWLVGQSEVASSEFDTYLETVELNEASPRFLMHIARKNPSSQALLDFLVERLSRFPRTFEIRLLFQIAAGVDGIPERILRHPGDHALELLESVPGALGYFCLGWPESRVGQLVRTMSTTELKKLGYLDRLLVHVAKEEVDESWQVVKELVLRPHAGWQHQGELRLAIRYWATQSNLSHSKIAAALRSTNDPTSTSILGMAWVAGLELETDYLVEGINTQLANQTCPPVDGIDVLNGVHSSWALTAYDILSSLGET